MACQLLISATGGLVVQTVVNLNEVTFIAGYTATYKLYGLLEVAAISYGYAVTTCTSQNPGAGKLDRIRKGWAVSKATALITSLCFALIFFCSVHPSLACFISVIPAQKGRSRQQSLSVFAFCALWTQAFPCCIRCIFPNLSFRVRVMAACRSRKQRQMPHNLRIMS